MLFVHPDDFDPVTSRIKLLAQVTWMQPSPVCTTYDGEYKYVRMYPMHLYFGKHIVRHSREVSIHWRYFGFGGSSRSIATLDVLVEQTRFHMNILRKHLKTATVLATEAGMTERKSDAQQALLIVIQPT